MLFIVEYIKQLSAVLESEVINDILQTNDFVLRMPLFQSKNPVIDWQCGQHLAW